WEQRRLNPMEASPRLKLEPSAQTAAKTRPSPLNRPRDVQCFAVSVFRVSGRRRQPRKNRKEYFSRRIGGLAGFPATLSIRSGDRLADALFELAGMVFLVFMAHQQRLDLAQKVFRSDRLHQQ